MKNAGKTIILIAVLVCILSLSASAHSGGTDSKGGHYVESTGEYHYHHGFPAHQHTDGVCPYEFKDKTNHNSSGSSSHSIVRSNDSSDSSVHDDTRHNKAWIFYLSFAGAATTAIAILTIRKKRREKLAREKREAEEKAAREQFEKDRDEFVAKFRGKSINEIAPPDIYGAYIGDDGLPRTNGDGKWGPVYTVFSSGWRSEVFHTKQYCREIASFPVNYVWVAKRRPCKFCCKEHLPDLTWYYKQKELLDLCKRYGVNPFVQKSHINEIEKKALNDGKAVQ